MNRCLFRQHLSLVALSLAPLPSLTAQSAVPVCGTVHYSGPHTGPVYVVALDVEDVSGPVVDPTKVPFAAQTTIPEPGPYSLTIPLAPPGHSYLVLAQMDIDGSGRFTLESFKAYEPSGDNDECSWRGCNAPSAIPVEQLADRPIEIYLSDSEPLCFLLDTFEADFLSDWAGGMDYHEGCLWICQPHIGGRTAVHQVDPGAGERIAFHDLGDGDATGVAWIGDDMWLCCREPSAWTVRQYTYDGRAFVYRASFRLPSSTDWNTVGSVNIAWDGALLWAQEKAPCGKIYKLRLSDGALVETVQECDFTRGKWLSPSDMGDICFADGYLWAMNDNLATFAKMAPDPKQLPPEVNYTFAFDPNRSVFDRSANYYGMVKHGDLIYFVEGIDVTDVHGTEIGQKHRIHTARIGQENLNDRTRILALNGQYWFGSLSVNASTNAPLVKRGTVSITGNQWDQQWDDYNGHHTCSSVFTTVAQPDGSMNVAFLDPSVTSTYNVAWNGDLMIHTGGVLPIGGPGIDIFTRKAANVDVNDVLGDHSFFGHHLNAVSGSDSCNWGRFTLNRNGTVTYAFTNDAGRSESGTISHWALDDVNEVIRFSGLMVDVSGAVKQDLTGTELLLSKGGIACVYGIVPGKDRGGDLDPAIFIKKTDQVVKMTDLAGTYHVRSFETSRGSVKYHYSQGTCVIKAVDSAKGTLQLDAYYSSGERDVRSIACSVGPGNELHLVDSVTPDGIVSLDHSLIFIPKYRYKNPPTRTSTDWLGGMFLIRVPDDGTSGSVVEKVPIYRFWSPGTSRHFYTAEEAEKQQLIDKYPADVWKYEGIAYHAMPNGKDPNSRPVYRFWSGTLQSHFYTISESEKDMLLQKYPAVWSYEKIAFYAYPPGQQPPDTKAVYRFWSDQLGSHFYTMDEAERDNLIRNYPKVWSSEGVAWYAYP